MVTITGGAYTGLTAVSGKTGIKCYANVNFTLTAINSYTETHQQTKYYVGSTSGGSEYGSGSLDGNGNVSGLSIAITSGSTFYITVDNNGSSYNVGYSNASFPYNHTEANIVTGIRSGEEPYQFGILNFVLSTSTNATVTPGTLTLSTTETSPLYLINVSPLSLSNSLLLKSFMINAYSPSSVRVGTGTAGTRFLKSHYPFTSGLIAGTTSQTGHTEALIPQGL